MTVLKIQRFFLIAFAFLQAGCSNNDERTATPPIEYGPVEFVDDETCRNCHPRHYEDWRESHHALAMDIANEKTVLGDFNRTSFSQHNVTTTFYQNDGEFFVNTDGPDGQLNDYKISYVFGFDPLQQYMIEFPDGRIQVLDIGWDTRPKEKGGQRWFHLHPGDNITHKHPFHWTKRFLNWNYMCAECHSTNLQKNYDFETNTFHTTWSEINVGCQGCHGPGSNHVKWARASQPCPLGQGNDLSGRGLDPSPPNFEKTSPLREGSPNASPRREDDNTHDMHLAPMTIEGCARCHSRRNGLREDYHYGKDFMDFYTPQLLLYPLYYPDGQILDEVYVYGSFLQSKKFHNGAKCSDCHDPHTSRLRKEGNALCVACHDAAPSKEFATTKRKNYDTPLHHFHEPSSSGAQCVNCHMPSTNYMVVDPRRDHSFQIPRPDLSVELGIPNACNRCHDDKPPEWAVEVIDRWYPSSKENREKESHFALAFAAGQEGKPEAEPGLIEIASDLARPAIIRSTALHLLGRYPSPQALQVMIPALEDDSPLVRQEAVIAIGAILSSPQQKLTLIHPLLRDPTLAVRTEAARVLTEVPRKLFDAEQYATFDQALEEYIHRQKAIADRPESHLNLGVMYQNLGKYCQAEASYLDALRVDSDFTPVRFNLANLYNAKGLNEKAEGVLRDIIAIEPGNGEAHYSLGLLLAEMDRLNEAVDFLEQASEMLPGRARVRYNYALALRHLGRIEESEVEMRKAIDSP